MFMYLFIFLGENKQNHNYDENDNFRNEFRFACAFPVARDWGILLTLPASEILDPPQTFGQ